MKFSEKLKKLRSDNNITQEELAERVHVSRVAVSKWETDRGYPNLDSLQLIAKTFDTTIDDLLSSGEIIGIAGKEKTGFVSMLSVLSFLLFILPVFRSVLPDGTIVSTWIFNVNYSAFFPFLMNAGSILLSVFSGIYNMLSRKGLRTKTVIAGAAFALMILCFALTLQPYPAVFALVLLLMLLKVSLL